MFFRNNYKEFLETLVVVYIQLKSKIETTMPLDQTYGETIAFGAKHFSALTCFWKTSQKASNLHVQ